MSDKPTTLEESPFFKEAVISHASLVTDPTPISLHLLVKNGAGVVGRLLENVGPYIREIVALLNDCEDGTEQILTDYGAAPRPRRQDLPHHEADAPRALYPRHEEDLRDRQEPQRRGLRRSLHRGAHPRRLVRGQGHRLARLLRCPGAYSSTRTTSSRTRSACRAS